MKTPGISQKPPVQTPRRAGSQRQAKAPRKVKSPSQDPLIAELIASVPQELKTAVRDAVKALKLSADEFLDFIRHLDPFGSAITEMELWREAIKTLAPENSASIAKRAERNGKHSADNRYALIGLAPLPADETVIGFNILNQLEREALQLYKSALERSDTPKAE